ncbi:MAG: chromate transporter [Treponema sp.]|jgi:chromate transporter|nr:chromate transporter [Treponema sp.]
MGDFLRIFFTFLKIGLITFGGGYSIMPVLERELVNAKGWLTMNELIEYYTIGQITPGIIAVNIATFVGYKQKKIVGAVLATFGFIFPGVTLITLTALLLENFSDITVVQHAFAGIRLVVAALITQTVVKLVAMMIQKQHGILKNAITAVICVASFTFSLIWKSNPIILIAASALAGFICFRRQNTSGGA